MLDDASVKFLSELAASGLPPMHELTPSEAREAGKRMVELYGEGPHMARAQDVDIEAADGGLIGLRLLVPDGPTAGVIVYWVTKRLKRSS